MNQWVRLKEFAEALAQRAGSVPMNDSDARLIRERGFVEVFVHALGCFFNAHANYVDFAGSRTFAGL